MWCNVVEKRLQELVTCRHRDACKVCGSVGRTTSGNNNKLVINTSALHYPATGGISGHAGWVHRRSTEPGGGYCSQTLVPCAACHSSPGSLCAGLGGTRFDAPLTDHFRPLPPGARAWWWRNRVSCDPSPVHPAAVDTELTRPSSGCPGTSQAAGVCSQGAHTSPVTQATSLPRLLTAKTGGGRGGSCGLEPVNVKRRSAAMSQANRSGTDGDGK